MNHSIPSNNNLKKKNIKKKDIQCEKLQRNVNSYDTIRQTILRHIKELSKIPCQNGRTRALKKEVGFLQLMIS